MGLINSALFSVMALATLFSASAEAESYRGILDDNGRPVPVTLDLHPDAVLGASAGHIRFGGPWACGFDIELTVMAAPQRVYFLKGGGAGRCTVLTSGYLHSQVGSDGLGISLFDRNNRAPALYRVTLRPTDG
jgi:hypothetical protein